MKYLSFIITVTLVSVLLPFQGKAETYIGYCGGEIAKTGIVSTEGNTYVSAAAYLTPEMLKFYDGAQINGLRGGLASRVNIDELKLWISEDLDGEPLAEGILTTSTDPSIAKGWNNVEFSTPVPIDARKGLYIGMTYHQKGTVAALSITGAPMEGACWVKLGSEAEWEESSLGLLSIEAISDTEIVIPYDLGLLSATVNTSTSPSYNFVEFYAFNNGREPIEGFTLTAKYTGAPDERLYEYHFDGVQPNEKKYYCFEIPKDYNIFDYPLSLSLKSIDGDFEDVNESNNTINAVALFVKKVLIEEFTTERCSNCPRAAGNLHTVLENPEFKDKIVAVCHHAGYFTDQFTQPCDLDFEDFFGIGFAPAMMYDRAPLFMKGGKSSVAPASDNSTIIDIEKYSRICLQEPAHVSISLSASVDEDLNILTINVEGERRGLEIATPRLTLYITEDDVFSATQTSSLGEFYHQHLIRAYNSTYGDIISWDGNRFSAEYTYDLDQKWDIKKMNAVALVSGYDELDPTKCQVDNVESIPLYEKDSSGIELNESQNEIILTEYYDIHGVRVINPSKGIVIKRTVYNDGNEKLEKQIF